MFECPGCGNCHDICIKPYKAPNGASWTWNGSMDKPTFHPSILAKVERTDGRVDICHLFVQEGRIHYLLDCTHASAGQSVDMPNQ